MNNEARTLQWNDVRTIARALTSDRDDVRDTMSEGVEEVVEAAEAKRDESLERMEEAAQHHDTTVRRQLEGRAPARAVRMVQAYPWAAVEVAIGVGLSIGLVLGTIVGWLARAARAARSE